MIRTFFGSLIICVPVLVNILIFPSVQCPSTVPELSCPFLGLRIRTIPPRVGWQWLRYFDFVLFLLFVGPCNNSYPSNTTIPYFDHPLHFTICATSLPQTLIKGNHTWLRSTHFTEILLIWYWNISIDKSNVGNIQTYDNSIFWSSFTLYKIQISNNSIFWSSFALYKVCNIITPNIN